MFAASELTWAVPSLAFMLIVACGQPSDQLDTIATDTIDLGISQDADQSLRSIYGRWSVDEIVDSLYSDTLIHRDYFDPSQPDTFYFKRIIALAEMVRARGNDTNSLFPQVGFNAVWARKAHTLEPLTWHGSAVALTDEQVTRLLRLLNNPIHFSWGECGTWEPDVRFEFLSDGSIKQQLDEGCGGQFMTDHPGMKFGSLTEPRRREYRALLEEIGMRTE